MGNALEGVRVLEYCDSIAGEYCAKLLADLGAEVIKIEKPGVGSETRKRPPFVNSIPHPEKSGLFLWLNTNKMGITLDIETPPGREIFETLLKKMDIFIEDGTPRVMRKMGLTYRKLKHLNSKLVMTSITPFGHTGPYRDYKTYPMNTFHSGSEGYITPGGSQDFSRPPLKVAKYAGEYESANSAAGATLAALYFQRSTGTGQHVDISKQEALLILGYWDLPRFPNFGLLTTRATRGYRLAGTIPCKDGFVELAFHRMEEWDALMDLLGNPDWSKEPYVRDPIKREERAAEIRENIAKGLAKLTKAEIYAKAQEGGVPLVPCFNSEELVNSKQLEFREYFVEIEHPEAGRFKYPTNPSHFSKTPVKTHNPAPTLGRDNERVYCEELNFTKEEMVRLRSSGII